MIEADSQLDEAFKQAMSRMAATVNVVSICVDGTPMGITATAVSAVSMDPPSLLVCVNQAATLHPWIGDALHFNVNVLHRDQADVAAMFADRKREAQRFLTERIERLEQALALSSNSSGIFARSASRRTASMKPISTSF